MGLSVAPQTLHTPGSQALFYVILLFLCLLGLVLVLNPKPRAQDRSVTALSVPWESLVGTGGCCRTLPSAGQITNKSCSALAGCSAASPPAVTVAELHKNNPKPDQNPADCGGSGWPRRASVQQLLLGSVKPCCCCSSWSAPPCVSLKQTVESITWKMVADLKSCC